MPRYVVLYRFTAEGAKIIRDTVKRARQTREQNEKLRAELFEKMHIASMEDPGAIPIAYIPNTAAVANDVHNFSYMLTSYFLLDEAWIEP